MSGNKEIPTIQPDIMDNFHFGNVEWRWRLSSQHHLFHINRLEDYVDKLSFPLPPHRKTVYDLIFITKGSSLRSKGLNQYEIQANQFFFLPALQLTSHESMSSDVEGYFLHFAAELFVDYPHILKPFSFLKFLSYPIISVPDSHQEPILNIFQRLEKLYQEMQKEDLHLVRWYLLALFTEANRYINIENELGKDNAASRLTSRFKDALSQHIYEKQSVRAYADLLHVTPNHLNKCVKNTLDKTAQNLLNEMLILEAKSLLKYSDLSIAQIAEQLCGQSPSNFTRFFKSQTDTSPKQYLEIA